MRRPNVVAGVNPYLDQRPHILNPAAFSVPHQALSATPDETRSRVRTWPTRSYAEQAFSPDGKNQPRIPRGVLQHSESHQLRESRELAAGTGLPSGGTYAGGIVPVGASIQPGQAFSAANAGANFGTLTSTVSNQIGLGTNRQIQLSLRLNF